MANFGDYNFRPGHRIQYARDHPLPEFDSDSEHSFEYYEEEEETASEFGLDEDSEGEVQPQNQSVRRPAVDNSRNNMAPNQSTPLVPFALAQGQVATDPDRRVICPACPPSAAGRNQFSIRSMGMHFNRRHNALFAQYFGVAPPALHPCPHAGGPGCTSLPFKKISDREDHLSEIHNEVPDKWRLVLNKQKRRKPHNLIADHVTEAAALNALITRIVDAEAFQPGAYVSQHGLPLVPFETVHDRVTDPLTTVAHQKVDVANKLIALRRTADQTGVLLGGGTGTWDQVAVELEARISGLLPWAGPVANEGGGYVF